MAQRIISPALRVILVREALLTQRAAAHSFNELAAALGGTALNIHKLREALQDLDECGIDRHAITIEHADMLARAVKE